MFAEWVARGKPSVLGIISGAVAGLVAITPASGFVMPGGALVIGIAAGVGCFWASTSLKSMLGYDDALDAFGVHAIGGIIGALLTGVFAREILNPAVPADPATGAAAVAAKAGLIDGNPGQVLTQAYGIACTLVYCAIATFIILKIIDVIIGLRVSEEVERDGLDLNLHGEVVQ
jgi:Amt family ammonium transporter